MGGIRGVYHYMQRVAIQGSPDMLTAIGETYQQGASGKTSATHPFKKYFEELEPGDQLITEPVLITAEEIDRFADLSGDHFYAHLRDTDFSDTLFEGQVAHGYLLMSLAAGLFVDGYEKNPVLLNYGIDALRFTKPVYPGTEIHVRFTCKDKTRQEQKEPGDIPRGIVRWLVEILDDMGELTGVATILTMVRRKE
jgi:oxepin-CoA hydrolase/3-oxo-5,6-dehydrosuberyl-CoA semialdehyde dehydrogenase